MANPFDDVINLKEERRDSPAPSKSSGGRDAITINLSISKRIFIHLGYLAIIVLLLFLVFKPKADAPIADFVPEVPPPAAAAPAPIVAAEPIALVLNETNTTTVNETAAEIPDLNNLRIEISAVNYLTVDKKILKINNITYTIFNQYDDFYPEVRAYWFDSKATVATQELVRGVSPPTRLSKGATLPGVMKGFSRPLVEQSDPKETVKLELYDQASGELLKEVIKIVP